ncbi:MAG: hypothetical protein M3161_04440, partial [Actinomycetota bacterium]|nr:hypothetical protein [Actinomycetota bacterium]
MDRTRTRAVIAVVASGLVAAGSVSPSAVARSGAPLTRLDLASFRTERIAGEYIVGYERGARRLGLAHLHSVGARAVASAGRRALLVRGADPATLLADASIRYVEPNYVRYLSQVIPNDPEFPNQWGLHNTGQQHRVSGPPPPGPTPSPAAGTPDADMDIPEAWTTSQGDGETVVATLDSGVDTTHPD